MVLSPIAYCVPGPLKIRKALSNKGRNDKPGRVYTSAAEVERIQQLVIDFVASKIINLKQGINRIPS